MNYDLYCGQCHTPVQLDSDIIVSEWVCPQCDNVNSSSLPATSTGLLKAQSVRAKIPGSHVKVKRDHRAKARRLCRERKWFKEGKEDLDKADEYFRTGTDPDEVLV